jgi:branched-chain amino acid transport system permease protein
MNSEIIIGAIISGILVGGLYALIGLGMNLIMGVLRIINLAHGEFLMLGMYAAFIGYSTAHLDPYLTILWSAPILFLIGVIIHRYLVAPVQRIDSILPENQVLLTVAIGIVVANVMLLIFTGEYRSVPTSYANTRWWLGPLPLNAAQTLAFITAIAAIIILHLFLKRTDFGLMVRATSQNPEAARLMGIPTALVSQVTFGVGVVLAGLAGTILAPIYYIYPEVGGIFTLKAFVVTILAGLGNLGGTLLAGVVLGLAESIGVITFGMGYKDVVGFVIFILALLLLPRGLLGRGKS